MFAPQPEEFGISQLVIKPPIGTMIEMEFGLVILAEYWIDEKNHDSTKLYDPIEMIYHHFDWLTLACCLWCHDAKIVHEPKE